MARRVTFSDQEKADIRALPQPVAIQIRRTLARLIKSDKRNVKRVQGVEPPLYRLRTQDHRLHVPRWGDHIEVARVRNRPTG